MLEPYSLLKKNEIIPKMKSFMPEDVQLALHSDLQPLQSSFSAPELGISAKRVLKACLEQQLQENVKLTQREGVLPDDEELAKLPIFQQALADDADHIRRAEEESAAREKSRRLAVEEAKRAEAERQRRAAEEAVAEAERKREAKEARRQARLVAKKEALKRTRAEEQRRYDELLSRWKSNVEERQSKLDEVKAAITSASEKKTAVQNRLAKLMANKTSLLKQLRDLAAQGTSGPGAGAPDTTTTVDDAATATLGGSDKDASHRSHLKRSREHHTQSSYLNSHHHHHSSSHHGSPPRKYLGEGSYERGIDRDSREYSPLGHLPPSTTADRGAGGGSYPGPPYSSRYGGYSDRQLHGRDTYGSIGDRGGYGRRDPSPGGPIERGERGGGGYHMHRGGGGGGGGGERDRGCPVREEFDARDRERERAAAGYHRSQHDEPRRDGGGGPRGGHRPYYNVNPNERR